MAELIRTLEREFKANAWVGGRERLARIVQILEQVPDGTVDSEPTHPLTTLIAIATESGGSGIRGIPGEVFESMDPKALRQLELEFRTEHQSHPGAGNVRISLELNKGVRLETNGDHDLVIGVFGPLETELQRGVPWWSWLRGSAGWVLYSLLAFAGFIGLTRDAVFGDTTTASAIGRVVIGAAVAWVVSIPVAVFVQRVLPGFEITAPGSQGKGARAIGVVGVTLLAAIGVVATFLAS